MPKLNHSKVLRCGKSVRYYNYETNKCSFEMNLAERALKVEFEIASKGGGITSLLLQISSEDFRQIFEAIASELPMSAELFSECALIANKKNLEQLSEANRVLLDYRARAKILLEKLEVVEDFVSQKWIDAPADNDKQEKTVKANLQEMRWTPKTGPWVKL